MEKKLRRLFDFQKFEQNEELNKVIEKTRERVGKKLSLDELADVAGGRGGFPTSKPRNRRK